MEVNFLVADGKVRDYWKFSPESLSTSIATTNKDGSIISGITLCSSISLTPTQNPTACSWSVFKKSTRNYHTLASIFASTGRLIESGSIPLPGHDYKYIQGVVVHASGIVAFSVILASAAVLGLILFLTKIMNLYSYHAMDVVASTALEEKVSICEPSTLEYHHDGSHDSGYNMAVNEFVLKGIRSNKDELSCEPTIIVFITQNCTHSKTPWCAHQREPFESSQMKMASNETDPLSWVWASAELAIDPLYSHKDDPQIRFLSKSISGNSQFMRLPPVAGSSHQSHTLL
ncbi:hypothetical protein DL89DRAFT_254566 [Linderina pennispora]|uniref:Uncharacterized protein n=1 Tax=Linderina pennispora TaxID=61395 RepID=A0A1Y1WNA6_9FUNG|nr:uncharacterized protein DL89DRAFT_254566 [Linderina pennispora]ORX74788.1 hypothetical protein DL89DRAFT_254566 [Linderina pennispora]